MDEPLSRREKRIKDAAYLLHDAADKLGAYSVYEMLAEAAVLHGEKNQGYRSSSDPFANFKENPVVVKGLLDPAQYAYVLMAKQDDALPRLLWARAQDRKFDKSATSEFLTRGGDAMLRERLLDGIVYRALIAGLVR